MLTKVACEKVYLPDTSSLLRGTLREAVREGKLEGKLVIHTHLVSFFEKLAREGSSRGLTGLRELKLLRETVSQLDGEVELELTNELPSGYRVLTRDVDPDSLIRDLALEWNATLITSDKISFEAAQALGIDVLYLKPDKVDEFILDKFFTENTMSVHLKEGVKPYAKVGLPGRWKFVTLREKPMTKEELEEIVRQIVEKVRSSPNAFIEVERPGSTIVQLEKYRIVITRPPFSDGIEITAVRPVAKLRLEDYNLPSKLIARLEKQAEGILIAGAPGMGKTTFAQALAEYYHRKGKVVKTIESPRDMQLPSEITQYSKTYATSEELHDVLLLSRPDYTFFDEMRDTKDFQLYADLRLAGVGMVGVVHATSPIDAIQRFIGRVELGMIPSIVDTVIFIEEGKVTKVYALETVVKVPHGLREAELARPVVVVKDFLTGEPEYELYVFGERTFVVPIKRHRTIARESKVRASIINLLRRYIPDDSMDIEVDEEGKVIVLVDAEFYNYMLGKPRKKLERLGRRLGVSIELRPRL